MSNTISISDFAQKARQAQAVGGALRLDKQGGLVVKGNNFFGRAALWLKDRLSPNKARAQNVAVLNAFEKSLNQTRSQSPQHRPIALGKPANLLGNSRALPADILQTIALLDKNSLKPPGVPGAGEAAALRFAHFMAAGQEGSDRQLYILGQAGSSPEAVGHREDLKEKYAAFVKEVSRNPSIREGVIPSDENPDYATFVNENDLVLQQDGGLTDKFLDACLVEVIRHEAAASPADRGKYEDQLENRAKMPSPLDQKNMDWIGRQYQALANALP